jgi:MarR family transcriptional regulator, organic hydroperoxide resistance regulator
MSSGVPVATTDFSAAWEAFFRTTRRLRARASALPGGLTLAQYQLLEPLRAMDEAPVGELAEAAGVAPPTATRMLDGLARDERIVRRHSKSDRRVVLVSLTPGGREALESAHEEAAAFRRRLFERLDPEEREHAAKLLERLNELLEEHLP